MSSVCRLAAASSWAFAVSAGQPTAARSPFVRLKTRSSNVCVASAGVAVSTSAATAAPAVITLLFMIVPLLVVGAPVVKGFPLERGPVFHDRWNCGDDVSTDSEGQVVLVVEVLMRSDPG